MGMFFRSALKVLHLLSCQKGFGGSSCSGQVVFPPSRGGKCCPFLVISFFSGSGSVSFAVFFRSSFLRVAV